tara:strand:+ start:14960 stop:17071 length:2112 start_codon:yes stop_codon:yes gene_type:complete
MWYPKRLLDLEDLRNANGLTELDGLKLLSEHGDIERTKVRLIEPAELIQQQTRAGKNIVLMKSETHSKRKISRRERENYRYVTLSHCWGKPKSVQGQLKLSSKTEERFKKEGIELRELPKTFRDAMLFACRLEKVGFIWIDSLCIKQRVTDSSIEGLGGAQKDWLEQSRAMDQIYRNSFLNISATAAVDGDQGLFCNRRPEYLWEDEININYTGTNLFGSTRTGSTQQDKLVRCTLIDVSFWDDLVERAPVNRRGWVLQERLMAPRVLHFCRDQIAWECQEFQAAEGHPEMNPTLSVKLGDIVDEGRLKDLTVKAGLDLRENRLKGLSDPDTFMPHLHVYELWKRVVEVYSRMSLTVSRDKLIALSGTARLFSDMLLREGSSQDYIVGMWSQNLESQLLWQVNEVFQDGVFENPARRDTSRAPSFSWASIDSPYGITYGDVTDYGAAPVLGQVANPSGHNDSEEADVRMEDVTPLTQFHARASPTAVKLDRRAARKNRAETHRIDEPSIPIESSNPTDDLFFKVLKHNVVRTDPENSFGMIKEGQLLIKPRFLRKIELKKLEPPLRIPFSWRLQNDDADKSMEHSNLILERPDTDADIFKTGAELYVMPAAYGERTVRKAFRYLYCLLLKYEGDVSPSIFGDATFVATHDQQSFVAHEQPGDGQPTHYRKFRRIGITKLSNHMDEEAQRELKSQETDEKICLV